jgi:hypothetical protein
LKRWETGLVCENCNRKAVALTLIKPGDIWGQHRRTRYFVGKRVCYRCVSNTLSWLLLGNILETASLSLLEFALFIAGVASFVGFCITGLLGVSPLLTITFLILSGTFFVPEPLLRKRIMTRRLGAKMKKPLVSLVSTKGFFENQTNGSNLRGETTLYRCS